MVGEFGVNSNQLLASEVMNKSASLLNDSARANFTYSAQLPYLQMALQDLRKLLVLNNSPVTEKFSKIIASIPIGTNLITFGSGLYNLPNDLISIINVYSTNSGSNNWIPLTKRESIPVNMGIGPGNQWNIYSWYDNILQLPYSNTINDLMIEYIRTLFPDVQNEHANLGIINADSYLEFRTAALCAEFIGENPTRALSLNIQAKEAFDVMIGIDNKDKQNLNTRRRPFRSGYKSRR